jgi:hypothetical protein
MTEDTRERFVTLVPQVDLGAAATGAIVASAWSEAGRHLLMFTDANLNTRVIAMTQADRLAMLPYVPAWNFRVRQALLRAVATTEIAASDWANAVQHLNGLFEADMAVPSSASSTAINTTNHADPRVRTLRKTALRSRGLEWLQCSQKRWHSRR